MAVDVAGRPGALTRVVKFYHDVIGEMRRVTWPDRPQVVQATWAIILFVLVIGAVIGLMDILLNALLVTLPTSFVR